MLASNINLVKIAALGGFATVTMGLLWVQKINYNIRQMEFYKETMKIVRNDKGAVQLLGEPIKERRIDIGDEKKNFTKDNKAQYEIPVVGPRNRGRVYFWAHKEEAEKEKWVVDRVELQLKNDDTKRLLIKS